MGGSRQAAGKLRQCLLLSAYYDLYCRGMLCLGMEGELASHFQVMLSFPAAAMQLLFCFVNPPAYMLSTGADYHHVPSLWPNPENPGSDPDFT